MADYDLEEAFEAIENELINSMIRNMEHHRVEEIEEGFEWTQWQAEELRSLEAYRKSNRKKYNKKFKEINKKIEYGIRKAHRQGRMDEEIRILEAIKKGFVTAREPNAELQGSFFGVNDRKLDALVEATMHDMKKAETAMLRMADDQYRKTIFNAQVYANTGAGTYEQAIDMATKDFRARGINCIEYKNGARVNIASYAAMAIRTANTRAYLQGEGTKRQEWGISTVIVGRRGHACLKCLKWVGKVLIDDVWSGGKKDDGPYPLMSTAMSAGLYHPNCKDTHTTYFPGISEEPKPLTRKEVDDAWNLEKKIAEQNYAQRQQKKWQRMADTSLDEDNRRMYQARADEWDKRKNLLFEQNKISIKHEKNAMSVNRELVNSKQYHDYFERIGLRKSVCESAYNESIRILEKADGSDLEYNVIIDARNGDVLVSTLNRGNASKDRVYLTDDEFAIIENSKNKIVSIHNHSRNGRPSGTDIVTCFKNDKIDCSIVSCHDGELFVLDSFNRRLDVDKIYSEYYNEEIRKVLSLTDDMQIPNEVGEKTVNECKIKATTRLYYWNKEHKAFRVRRINSER